MVTEATSATQQKLDFMTLLVTELQNQNPLEPMDHQQMAAQLAQFSQLELTENMTGSMNTMSKTMDNMNNSFQGSMLVAQLDYAKSLIGREVSFYDEATGTEMAGQVKKITFPHGLPVLHTEVTIPGAGAKTYDLDLPDITGIGM
ncbi:MAG: hypothetical protein LLF76_11480 [Planctomycetaceae bacterium]|nr:hypothetical protein [Planctomycetaceae bacterium]